MAENDDGTKTNTLATEKVIPPQGQTVQGSKRKEVPTVQMTVVRLTRKQLLMRSGKSPPPEQRRNMIFPIRSF